MEGPGIGSDADKEVIVISFSELRKCSQEVLSFTRDSVLEGNISLISQIARDGRIAGDDIYFFLADFAKKFNVDLSGLDFDEHFYGEGEGIQFFPFSIWFYTISLIYELICSPFSKKRRATFRKALTKEVRLDRIYGNSRKDLMVADLVVSAMYGKFQLKKNVTFVLNKA